MKPLRCLGVVGVLPSWILFTSIATATPLPLTLEITDGVNQRLLALDGTINPDGTYSAAGSATSDTWSLGWDIHGKLGPNYTGRPLDIASFEANLAITDLTDATQAYQVTTTMTVGAINPSTLFALVHGFLLEDLNGNTATYATNPATGNRWVTYLVDEYTYATQGGRHPTSVTIPANGVGRLDPQGPFIFIPENQPPKLEGLDAAPGPKTISTMGVREEFTLTSNDRFSPVQIVRVRSAVPEPNTIVLAITSVLIMSCAALVRTRRMPLFDKSSVP